MEHQPGNIGWICEKCGGKDLCFGYVGGAGNAFVPSNMFTIHGYKIRTSVCLKCGHVTQFLPKDKLEKLREKYFERFSGK